MPRITASLRSRHIERRVHDRDQIHAKAHATHAALEVIGSQALVGSSNFTLPRITQEIEPNIQLQPLAALRVGGDADAAVEPE